MKEKPILFSGPMVRAILEGRKTQTRRIVKKIPCECNEWEPYEVSNTTPEGWQTIGHSNLWSCNCCIYDPIPCPYPVGTMLWVRETWKPTRSHLGEEFPQESYIRYRADDSRHIITHCLGGGYTDKWKPSIFMPRWASRITLEVTDVRVERLQEITEEDAIKEGIGSFLPYYDGEHTTGNGWVNAFANLWDSINGKKYPWEYNPWVWVITFRRLK